jgi:hypothetical protein
MIVNHSNVSYNQEIKINHIYKKTMQTQKSYFNVQQHKKLHYPITFREPVRDDEDRES